MTSVLEQTFDYRGIAVLTLNRPEARNALSDELFEALLQAVTQLERRDDVGVIIFTGKGAAFCGGGDVSEMPGNTREISFETRVANLLRRSAVIPALCDSSKLTIAMINGAAVGAGMALALACDFRIGSTTSRFSTAYLNMALAGDCGAIHLLTRLVGEARAKEMMFLPEMMSAARAAEIGVLNRCVGDDQLRTETLALATRLAAGPRTAQRYMKMNFRNSNRPFADALREEAGYLVRSAMTDDHAEARAAFKEKRAPHFGAKK